MVHEPYIEVRPLRKGPRNQFNAVMGMVGLLAVEVWTPGRLPLYWQIGLIALGVLLVLPITLSVRTLVSLGRVNVTFRPFGRWSFPVEDVDDMEIVASDHLVSLFGGRNLRVSRFGTGTMGEGDRSIGNMSVKFTLSSGRTHQVGSFHPRALLAAVEAERARALDSGTSGH